MMRAMRGSEARPGAARPSRAGLLLAGLLAAGSLAAARPAGAGIHFRAVNWTGDPASGGHQIEVEGWVAGEKARFELRKSENPVAKAGTYLVTRDAGKSVYLVDPQQKTYSRWNLEPMLGLAEGVTEPMGPLLDIELSQERLERFPERDGGKIAGLPTRLYRYRVRYTTHVRVLGMDSTSDTLIEQSIWRTDKLKDAALGVWLRASAPHSGDPKLDQLLATEVAHLPGLPLKAVTSMTTTPSGGDKGKPKKVSRTSMEVTQLDAAAVPDSSFEIPPGYSEKQVAPGTEGEKSPP
jgi:hypothetical protein